MEQTRPLILVVLVTLLASALAACVASGQQLTTVTADPRTISGTYDLITYGCRYPYDLERAAFLVLPERTGSFELFVPATAQKIRRGLPAAAALAEAEKFIRCGTLTVEETRFHRIRDAGGNTLGYEVLPRFPAYEAGGMDPLLVDYWARDGKVRVNIRLSPEVERRMGPDFPRRGRP